MLDLENYVPPQAGHKCKECDFFLREGNPFSPKVVFRCKKKPFTELGKRYYHKVKANAPACGAFKN